MSEQLPWDDLQIQFAKYLSGDANAAHSLFLKITDVLKGFFVVRTRNVEVAEELAQVTLLKIHYARERFDTSMSLKTWVYTIAHRSLIDHWRGLESDPVELDTTGEESASMPASELNIDLKLQWNKDLNNALNSLKPNDRMIVYLYVVEGLSMKEIGKALHLTETAVKIRAHRSYSELKKLLSADAVKVMALVILLKELL